MERSAGALASLGVGKGDRVGVFALNGMDYLMALFGAWRLGAISALVNLQYADSLDYFVNDAQPRVLVYTGHHFATIERQRANLASVELSPRSTGCHRRVRRRPPVLYLGHLRAPQRGGFGPRADGSSHAVYRGAATDDVRRREPRAHRPFVFVPTRGEAAPGATVLAANPTVLRDLLDESGRRQGAPSRLRAVVSGGGPVPPELTEAFRDTLGLPLCESGRPLPDKEVRVLDDDGVEVPVGELGELCLRGGFMTGYWNRPEQTREILRGGWPHTGDVGFIDGEGFVFMRGRLSERLTVDGAHWYPRDVEEALIRHPSVREAALVGLPDPALAQRPVAYVTARDGYVPDTHDLVEFVTHGLGRPVPSMTVEVLDSVPMTPTGKISKAQLLAKAAS